MSYTISKIKKTENGVSQVELSGQLVVTYASKIKADLAKLKFKTKQVNFMVKDVDDFDLGMAQLLKAYALKQKSNNTNISYDFELNDDLSVLLTRSGIKKELNQ